MSRYLTNKISQLNSLNDCISPIITLEEHHSLLVSPLFNSIPQINIGIKIFNLYRIRYHNSYVFGIISVDLSHCGSNLSCN